MTATTELRRQLTAGDPAKVAWLVSSTGFFSPEEVAIAVELAEDALSRGNSSDYRFIVAEVAGELAGYSCFGRIPATIASWDIYWIAVAPGKQREGLGRHLMMETEAEIGDSGGMRIYVDTSSRKLYTGTRAFYERCGYEVVARLPDFYGPGDGKIILSKALGEDRKRKKPSLPKQRGLFI